MVKTKEEFEASNNASNIIPMIVSKLHRGVIKLGEKDNKSNNRLKKTKCKLDPSQKLTSPGQDRRKNFNQREKGQTRHRRTIKPHLSWEST